MAVERLHEPTRVVSRGEYLGEVEPLLDAMCSAFARQALRALDPHGAWIDPSQLLSTGTVIAACEPTLHNLLRMMVDDEVLEQADGRWLWRDESTLPDPQDIWISLIGDYPDYAGLIRLAGRAGLRLPDVLSGRMDPEEIVARDCRCVGDRALRIRAGFRPSCCRRCVRPDRRDRRLGWFRAAGRAFWR